jgi:hypothetical protein
MNDVFHVGLADTGWEQLSLLEQMGNIGSEVSRALSAREREREERAEAAAVRALELFDLTLADPKNRARLREIARARECFADFFFGGNGYGSTAESWQSYFLAFAVAARRDR